MAFAALDDEFFGHPKTAKAGNDGAGVYARALSYCAHYLTDGFVPLAWVSEIAKPALRRKITDAGFWVEVTGGERYEYLSGDDAYVVEITEPGFFIPDFPAYNPTRGEVLEKRSELSEKRSEAGRKGALKRWQRDSKPDGKPAETRWQNDGKAMANGWPPSPTPKEKTSLAVTSLVGAQPPPAEAIERSLGGAA